MITLPLAARIKADRRAAYEAHAINRYGVDQWFSISVGHEKPESGSVNYVEGEIWLTLADLEYTTATLFTNWETAMLDQKSFDLMNEDAHNIGINPVVRYPAEGFVEVHDLSLYSGMIHAHQLGDQPIPFHFFRSVNKDRVYQVLTEAEAQVIIARAQLSGMDVIVTGMNASHIHRRMNDWLAFGGYLRGVIEDSTDPGVIYVGGRSIPLSSATYRATPDRLKFHSGDPVMIRTVANFSMMTLPLSMTDLIRNAVGFMRSAEDAYGGEARCAQVEGNVGPGERVYLHEIRHLSKAEREFLNNHQRSTGLTADQVQESLGETLRDLIKLAPASTMTRGFVFARTEVQLKPEVDDYDKVIQYLRDHPGRLRQDYPAHIIMPKELQDAGESWWREEVGVAPISAPSPMLFPPAQPIYQTTYSAIIPPPPPGYADPTSLDALILRAATRAAAPL